MYSIYSGIVLLWLGPCGISWSNMNMLLVSSRKMPFSWLADWLNWWCIHCGISQRLIMHETTWCLPRELVWYWIDSMNGSVLSQEWIRLFVCVKYRCCVTFFSWIHAFIGLTSNKFIFHLLFLISHLFSLPTSMILNSSVQSVYNMV